MVFSHFTTYLGSRGAAAVFNLLSVAVFARLAGPETYGHYLLITASAMVVFGFAGQWACAAFFATYSEHHADNRVASFVLLIMGMFASLGLGVAAAGLMKGMDVTFLGALIVMAAAFTLFEAAVDVARTRLEPGRAAVAMLLRATATLALGTGAIAWLGSATALALAVAAANVMAALVCLLRFVPSLWRHATLATALHLLRYGWPLILAFGFAALGQNIDRLLLGGWVSVRELGPYGAISDLIKQTFFVVGSSVALAFISVAKRSAAIGDHAQAGEVLEAAFTSLIAIAAFGAGFFLCFGSLIFNFVFGPEFARFASGYFPILILANAFFTLRAFYFGQVIYFSQSSRLELWISLLTLLVSGGLSALLIPLLGTAGAAASLLAGQITACLGFAFAGRHSYRLPVPIGQSSAIIALVVVVLGLSVLVNRTALSPLVAESINAILFTASVIFAVYRFKLFGLRLESWSRLAAR